MRLGQTPFDVNVCVRALQSTLFYNVSADPWNAHDLYETLPQAEKETLRSIVARVSECRGQECP